MSRLAGRGRGCRRLGRYHAGVQMHPLPFHSPKSCSTGMGAMLMNPRLCRSRTECGGQGAAGRNSCADGPGWSLRLLQLYGPVVKVRGWPRNFCSCSDCNWAATERRISISVDCPVGSKMWASASRALTSFLFVLCVQQLCIHARRVDQKAFRVFMEASTRLPSFHGGIPTRLPTLGGLRREWKIA